MMPVKLPRFTEILLGYKGITARYYRPDRMGTGLHIPSLTLHPSLPAIALGRHLIQ